MIIIAWLMIDDDGKVLDNSGDDSRCFNVTGKISGIVNSKHTLIRDIEIIHITTIWSFNEFHAYRRL